MYKEAPGFRPRPQCLNPWLSAHSAPMYPAMRRVRTGTLFRFGPSKGRQSDPILYQLRGEYLDSGGYQGGIREVVKFKYDKVPEAINFRALAQKIQLKHLESKVTISIICVIWRLWTQESWVEFFEQGPKIYSFRLFVIQPKTNTT